MEVEGNRGRDDDGDRGEKRMMEEEGKNMRWKKKL